jgi:hypothetical protein
MFEHLKKKELIRRLEAVEAVLIENRRGTTNQPWLWDQIYDTIKPPLVRKP